MIEFTTEELVFLGVVMDDLKDDQSLNQTQRATATDIWIKVRQEIQDKNG